MIYSEESGRKPEHLDYLANDLLIEQEDIPMSFGLHLNLTQIEQLKRNSSMLSVSSVTSPNNQSLNKGKKFLTNLSILKLFKVIRAKIQNLKNRKHKFANIQNVYQEKTNNDVQKKVNSKYVFDPNNIVYLILQQVKLFFMLFLLLFITFIWSFDYIDCFLQDLRYITFISLFLFLDIITQFNIAIIIKGQIIKNRVSIVKNYLTGQFIEDIIFLLSLVFLIYTKQIFMAAVFYASGTKILYKIINKLQDIFDLSMYSSEIVKLIKLVLFINLIAHFIACVWHYVGQNTTYLGITWLEYKGIRNESAQIRYIYSFYWAVVTMVTVGYGDIAPVNYLEMIVSVVVMFLSCGIFAFSLNLIGQIVSTVNQEKVRLEKNIRTLNNYFKSHNIDDELQNRVKNYMEYSIREEEKENIKAILDKLPNHLQQEVIQKAYFNILCQTPLIFNSFSTTLLKNSSHLLQMEFYQPEDIIVNQYFDSDVALYFIHEGKVQVIEQSSKTILLELKHGDTFNLQEFFTGKKSRYTVICKTKTSILKMPRQSFINLLLKDDFEKFHEIKHCFEFNITIGDLQCTLCKSSEHLTDKCSLFFYVPDISRLFVRKQNLKQKRDQFDRREGRYNTLLNAQKQLEKQFQFMQNYQQENTLEEEEEIENPINKTFDSNQNNFYRLPEHSIASDIENPFLKPQKSKLFQTVTSESNTQIKHTQPLKDKSQQQIKQQSAQEIKEKDINLEYDRMAEFQKYFSDENYEKQIKKYNIKAQKLVEAIPQRKRKYTKAMKFIYNF